MGSVLLGCTLSASRLPIPPPLEAQNVKNRTIRHWGKVLQKAKSARCYRPLYLVRKIPQHKSLPIHWPHLCDGGPSQAITAGPNHHPLIGCPASIGISKQESLLDEVGSMENLRKRVVPTRHCSDRVTLAEKQRPSAESRGSNSSGQRRWSRGTPQGGEPSVAGNWG
jgi:hypothetical protein